ncbi:MAG: hypothetical protein OK439_00330 [Thaumarchaeota archaeon]|nr:hypothetical protein [Nitrososphaerota archaeon]
MTSYYATTSQRQSNPSRSRAVWAVVSIVLILVTVFGIYIATDNVSCPSSGSACMSITNKSWEFIGLIGTSISVGSTGSAGFSFNVQNFSTNQSVIYSGLIAQAIVSPSTPNIVITPNPQNVPSLAYQGTSAQLNFNVSTSDAPNGKYNVIVAILLNGGIVTSTTLQIVVQ